MKFGGGQGPQLVRDRCGGIRYFPAPLGIVTFFHRSPESAGNGSNSNVIASQCAHWRGNLPE